MSSEVKTPNPFQRLYRGLTTIDFVEGAGPGSRCPSW